MSRSHPIQAVALVAALAFGLAACGSSSGDADQPTTTTEAEAPSTTVAASNAPLKVLVSNDDGYSAEGIDTLVEALRKLDGVEVSVVAPLEQQSGTGGKTTDGAVTTSEVKTLSGFPATAVDGFPSDAVRYGIDDLDLQPDLVITGINEGQNLGPAVDLSGTIGAARAAVELGIPALATSQGFGDPVDYRSAVPFIIDWVEEHRAAIAAGKAPVTVTNINVPSCSAGEVRGLEKTTADLDGDLGSAGATSNCQSTAAADSLDNDVELFLDGFATITPVSATPTS